MSLSPGAEARFATALAVSTGLLAAVYVAACVLPNGPTDAGRIQFTLDSPVPYRVPLAGAAEPRITISADGQVLKHPPYRLETLSPGIVRVDSTEHRLLGVARGTASVRVVYLTATGAPDTVFAVQVVVARVAVNLPNLPFTRLGDTTRLTATALDANGAVVPNVAFGWSSSDPHLATVSVSGLVTAVNEGTVTITAAADSVAGVATVAVTQVAAAVQVAPALDTLRTLGRKTQFIAVVFDDSGRVLPSAKPWWSSSDNMIARVDSSGLATATGAGTARIIARVGTAADTGALVVSQFVRFLVVAPGLDTLTAIQESGRIVAQAADSAGKTIPAFLVSWMTSDPTVATVDPTGRVTAQANGVVLVTASSDGQSAFATVLVQQEAVIVRLSQDSVALAGQGDTVRLSAVGLDRNGYPVAGAAFAWRSSSCVATVDTAGLVRASGGGSAAIIAAPANGGQSDTAVASIAGAPPPCQHAIAFGSNRDGNPEIYVMDADGSDPRNLTNNPDSDYAPVWSPDGKRIAFVSNRDGNPGIYVMNADGSGLQNLAINALYVYEPVWSPDGTRIAFLGTPGGNFGIYVMNADGSGLQFLTSNSYENPTWSPDGTMIAFGGGDIYRINADGSGLKNLTNNPGNFGPAWSPDGTRIAFGSYRTGNGDLYVINADGLGLKRLTGNAGDEHSPVWSPDGSKIAYQAGIFIGVADSSVGRLLTFRPMAGADYADYSPAWSPDGMRIVFTSRRDGNAEIYVINIDRSGFQNLTNHAADDYTPVWRPR